MKNLGSNIVYLMNMLNRNKVFKINKLFTSTATVSEIQLKSEESLEIIKNALRGKVSYVFGNDPLIFAARDYKGKRTANLNYTYVTACKMLEL